MGHGGELSSASVVFFGFGLHPERCILVIMVTVGPHGSRKSRIFIDLASRPLSMDAGNPCFFGD